MLKRLADQVKKANEDTGKVVKSLTSADQVEKVKEDTEEIVKSLTPSERFYLYEVAKEGPRNADKTSQLSFAGQNTTLYVPLITDAVKADGTYEPFGAVFNAMASFGDAGSGSVPSAQSGIQTQVFGDVTWESQHFGFKNTTDGGQVGYKEKVDFSFGGGLGLYPALVLENLTSTTATITQPNARPMFQDAFRWSIGPNMNFLQFSHGESTAFVDMGENFLVDEVTSYKEGDDTITATPVSNNASRAAAFYEAGLETRILAVPIWVAHEDKISNLAPLFLMAVGVRKDTRFSASGDLVGYDHPQDRLFYKFFIDLTKIVSYTDETKPASTASLQFGVDYEKPVIEQRIPAATRIFISANVDIMKVFRPSANGGT